MSIKTPHRNGYKKLYLACSLGLLFSSAAVLAAEPFSADSAWMLGDWGGTRSTLKQDGVDFQINYTGEAASNLDGGYNASTTARYADQWQFGVTLDLEKLLNWSDTEFQATITDRNGRNLNEVVGDPRVGMLSQSQEVYGAGQTWRLSQFWLRQGYFNQLVDIRLGRVGVGEDFGTFQSNFQNLAMGSSSVGNWRGDRWYNWPISQWGGRVKVNLTPELYTQVGIYNQNPKNYDTGSGFRMDISGSVGNLIPVEVGWLPKLGAEQLPGKYKVGFYYSTPKGDVYSSARINNGTVQYYDSARAYGGYMLAQQQLTSVAGDSSRGLTVVVQGVMNDQKTSKTDNFQSIAFTYTGLFDARPKDEIGVGAARIHVNSNYSHSQRLQNQSNNVFEYRNPTYLPVQKGSEYDMEIYYGIHATNWLTVRPNLQFVSAPGAVSEVKNALIGGISVNVAL